MALPVPDTTGTGTSRNRYPPAGMDAPRTVPVRSAARERAGQAVQYWLCLPIERYMQSAFSRSWSTASRLRLVSRSITSSGG